MAKKPQNSTKEGAGFGLGVALGTSIGAGAMLMLGTKEGRKFKRQLYKDFKQQLEAFRKKHPQQTKKVEDALEQALLEARSASKEIKQVAKEASKKARQAKKKAQKRLFIKKGKPLNRRRRQSSA